MKNLYDLDLLSKNCPELAQWVIINPYGNQSIDFANPIAVKTLNKALLKTQYNITWELLEDSQGKKITVLDIGVGANCIYPLIGTQEYGWNFVGTEIDPHAISIANGIIAQNNLQELIEIRLQPSPSKIFENISDNLIFDVSMCNPPFHASRQEADAGTKRKWKNLRKNTNLLNFGGQSNELWCKGGEASFIKQIIQESVHVQCAWFTSLVSKKETLPTLYQALDQIKASEVKIIPLEQGNKKSRIVAWKVPTQRSTYKNRI